MDHAATTPLHPEVREAMIASLELFGNPSSVHASGREAKSSLHRARDQVAAAIGCGPHEIIFTSGGSESDNTAIMGVLWSRWLKQQRTGDTSVKPHMITTTIEHHAVLHTAEQAEKLGFEVSYIPPDSSGMIHPEQIKAAIQPNTCLISVMYVNNEVGTIQPIEEIGRIAHEHGIIMHTDAVQALGVIPFQLRDMPVDLASFSAHKINGPKGTGALYAKHGVEWEPYLVGGSQERKRRAGTENVAGIVGFGVAAEIASKGQKDKILHAAEVRDALWNNMKDAFGDRVLRNGNEEHAAPHILNVSLLDVPTETLLMNLDMMGIMASSGSACTSGSLEVSHVLEAMHLPLERTRTAVRFSVGLGNTVEQAHAVVKQLEAIVSRVRTRRA